MTRLRTSMFFALLLGIALTGTQAVSAAEHLQVASIFQNRMMLQKGDATSISGKAKPGAEVTVTFTEKTYRTKADAAGRWKLLMKCEQYGGPHELVVSSLKDTVTFKDVLIGEVWLCSGQSNMGSPISQTPEWPEMSKTMNYPDIRFLGVYDTPGDIWTPHESLRNPAWWSFRNAASVKNISAVTVAFMIGLQKELKVPVGFIFNARGGVPIETYMSMRLLKSKPIYKTCFDNLEEKKIRANNFDKKYANWQADYKAAKATGKPLPNRPWPHPWARRESWPSTLHNTILSPVIPHTIRGAVWYQGESNAGNPLLYRSLLPDMIGEWRRYWNNPEMPFLIVQIAPQSGKVHTGPPVDNQWVRLMEVQLQVAEADKHAEVVTSYDLPRPKEGVHYQDKVPVGKRLVKVAMDKVYGKKIMYSGPRYRSLKHKGNTLELQFDHTGTGLTVKKGDKKLAGFAIAGEDRKFVWAKARIQDDKLVVWSELVKEPVAVRYAWSSIVVGGNLWNKDGFPAFPFRTDDWPYQPVKRKR